MNKTPYIGTQKLHSDSKPVMGEYVNIEGETFYKIGNFDEMTPFFMTIVSNSDHWMFISSNGGLTAGRKNPDNALFPYYTDDIIHTCHETTGSKTIIQVHKENSVLVWEPFSEYYKNAYDITRNIYKNIPGNKIVFEEINRDLDLSFSYSWMNSERFGFIKRSKLLNFNKDEIEVNILDGQQNILPYGIYQQFQNQLSTLADGYKKNELLDDVGIGIFSLSSIPSDRAEPSESLRATLVWSTGLNVDKYLLSSRQLNDYRICRKITNENDIKATRGAYFIQSHTQLKPQSSKHWFIVSEINCDSSDLANLSLLLKNSDNLENEIIEDVDICTESLVRLVAAADGLQCTNDKLVTSRHYSNVLFNIMRGGIFIDSYAIEKNDFISFLESTNKDLLNRHEQFLSNIAEKIHIIEFVGTIQDQKDSQFTKLAREYLPLSFSRRHGDPSRPWNRFSIDLKNDKDEKILNYQGNWRDIFQNWEALALSFPNFLESMITKFLNATTADGYNPYRVTKDGFDWEILEPDVAWSNIGYWGDHQIIYLLKLLELSSKYNPSGLKSLINDEIFTYANVPYRIKSYYELLQDSKDTIEFDHELNGKIISEEQRKGSVARFLTKDDGTLYQVNFVEKLLIPLLSKLSNFIPEGGIWMNTQRPEWNDANNALVGDGISMVTLYYIKRYIQYCIDFFASIELESFKISNEVKDLLIDLFEVFENNKNLLHEKISDEDRKLILDGLGLAGSKFRESIYSYGFSPDRAIISRTEILDLVNVSQKYVDHSIKMNKRRDGLYHSYNLMTVNDDKIMISHLYEMLEGQVAVLSSGYLSSESAIELLKSLRESSLYREDQNSYILYPDRKLPLFVEKNIIPFEISNSSEIIKKLVNNRIEDILDKDLNGAIHFNGDISNGNILENKLRNVNDRGDLEIDEKGIEELLNIYESIFNHKAFTGRSGTFYKYEGLGSIYWHMVSKLALAVEEVFYNAKIKDANRLAINKLREYYYNIKDGIGLTKSPYVYGAFPTDPYSHTPCFSGVQQPGLTGQVKEDILSRFGELGVIVEDGKIRIDSELLNKDEFLVSEDEFSYFDINGEIKKIKLEVDSMAFTYCQIPIIYTLSSVNKVIVNKSNSSRIEFENLQINSELSRSIFNRDGLIESIVVHLIVN